MLVASFIQASPQASIPIDTYHSAIVVGAGPAGASLSFLLARRGIEVVLLEPKTDFAREFRGEGLVPNGIDVLRVDPGKVERVSRS